MVMQDERIYLIKDASAPAIAITELGAQSLERAGYERTTYEMWKTAVDQLDDVTRQFLLLEFGKYNAQSGS